jgi:hypothetical protein
MQKLFCLALLLFQFVSLRAQHVKATPLEMSKNTIFSKIMWVTDSSLCVASEREFNGVNFPHYIFTFDEKGKAKHDPVKVKTAYSLQSDYCFSLGTNIFFLDVEQSEMGYYDFKIKNRISETGADDDRRENIFHVSKAKEKKKLNSDSYSFKVYRGTGGSKAVLAYNNDYRDEYREGFRFRILDAVGKLSTEDTLILPYIDRACNISDVLYDDETNKLYLLCNIFSLTGADTRFYINSVIGEYDCTVKTYREISDGVPDFRECKMQQFSNDNMIAFTGLYADEKSPAGWWTAFLSVRKEPFEIMNASSANLNPEMTKMIYGLDEFIHPVNFLISSDSTYSAGWTKFPTLSQIASTRSGNSGAILFGGIMFGLIGAATMAAATSGSIDISAFERALLLQYSPVTKTLIEDTVSSNLTTNKYHAHSYAALTSNGKAMWFMNKPMKEYRDLSTLFFSPFGSSLHSCDSTMYYNVSDFNVNLIYPGSHYTYKNKNYFLGEYNPGYFYYSRKPFHHDEKIFFLVEID